MFFLTYSFDHILFLTIYLRQWMGNFHGYLPYISIQMIRLNVGIANRMINWAHVFTTYIPMLFVLGVGVFLALIVHQVVLEFLQSTHVDNLLSVDSISAILGAIRSLVARQIESLVNLRKEAIFAPSVEICFVILVVMAWILRMDNPVYLLSFATFKAPDSWRITHDEFLALMRSQGSFTDENMGFMERLLARSGIGQSTAFPPGIVQCLDPTKKADRSSERSRKEAQAIIFDIVERAMKKANVKAKDIDVLVINCSLFSPTPSLCAMVISHFKMRSDILSYNLSGMGCGASLLALDLGAKMLQRRSVSGKALIVSTEILTPNLYYGNERGFLLQNTLFRCGGAAMVLSNSWFDGQRALFKLLHLVRTQGTGESAYECVYETEDSAGHTGVRLSKDIVKVAGKCMEKNMTTMGPYVLPISEQLKVVACLVARYVLKTYGKIFNTKKYPLVKVYVPDFKRGIDHFCIHAGGRAVIDGKTHSYQ